MRSLLLIPVALAGCGDDSSSKPIDAAPIDPTRRRLFIIEHSATVGVPDKLHVRPLDG